MNGASLQLPSGALHEAGQPLVGRPDTPVAVQQGHSLGEAGEDSLREGSRAQQGVSASAIHADRGQAEEREGDGSQPDRSMIVWVLKVSTRKPALAA